MTTRQELQRRRRREELFWAGVLGVCLGVWALIAFGVLWLVTHV